MTKSILRFGLAAVLLFCVAAAPGYADTTITFSPLTTGGGLTYTLEGFNCTTTGCPSGYVDLLLNYTSIQVQDVQSGLTNNIYLPANDYFEVAIWSQDSGANASNEFSLFLNSGAATYISNLGSSVSAGSLTPASPASNPPTITGGLVNTPNGNLTETLGGNSTVTTLTLANSLGTSGSDLSSGGNFVTQNFLNDLDIHGTATTGYVVGNYQLHGGGATINSSGLTLTLDGVDVAPEPVSLLMMGGGLMLLAGIGLRKRNSKTA